MRPRSNGRGRFLSGMNFLQSIDTALFNLVNQTMSNPVFDWLMPILSGNRLFAPFALAAAVFVIWRHRTRGILCVTFILLAVGIGDGFVINTIKHAVWRLRPANEIASAITLVGSTNSPSFPSAHSANAFAVAMVLFVYFRGSWRFMLPLAFGIAFSRVYNGVHYPSDTVVGAMMGAGYGLAFVWMGRECWNWIGPRWFPAWWAALPDLMNPDRREALPTSQSAEGTDPQQIWLRLGYVLIAAMFVFRLWYIGSGKIELSEDEAYQWQWSQHLDLSYFSKPPLIAYTQAAGTGLWGNNAFGVRFFSPVIAMVLGWTLLRFFRRQGFARVGFWLVLLLSVTPLTAVGSVLMVIDSLSVTFWALAMLSGWAAIQNDCGRAWVLTGLWLGLGFLAKYTALLQLVSFALVFMCMPESRRQLKRPGPYMALVILALSTLPVLIWNAGNDWITVTHLGSRAGLGTAWRYNWNFMQDFLLSELGLLNPILFVAMIWAVIAFRRRYPGDKLMLYLFCMGAPLFAGYFLYTIRSRVQPNWIAPAIVPLFALMILYWSRRHDEGARFVKRFALAALVLGLPLIVVLHDTNIPGKLLGVSVPPKLDPLRRVRAWSGMAGMVEAERRKMEGEGKAVFLIGAHYGITSLMSFYIPEANRRVSRDSMVYYQTAEHPENQYYFWPGYGERKGENAIYVARIRLDSEPTAPPERIVNEFESVESLGLRDIEYRGRVFHRVQLFACRGLR
jgi:4-amino-4-deoxy-L-arabinose transferase-like glycosyltransferase/membrane-associated phospholipid phosphatase